MVLKITNMSYNGLGLPHSHTTTIEKVSKITQMKQ